MDIRCPATQAQADSDGIPVAQWAPGRRGTPAASVSVPVCHSQRWAWRLVKGTQATARLSGNGRGGPPARALGQTAARRRFDGHHCGSAAAARDVAGSRRAPRCGLAGTRLRTRPGRTACPLACHWRRAHDFETATRGRNRIGCSSHTISHTIFHVYDIVGPVYDVLYVFVCFLVHARAGSNAVPRRAAGGPKAAPIRFRCGSNQMPCCSSRTSVCLLWPRNRVAVVN